MSPGDRPPSDFDPFELVADQLEERAGGRGPDDVPAGRSPSVPSRVTPLAEPPPGPGTGATPEGAALPRPPWWIAPAVVAVLLAAVLVRGATGGPSVGADCGTTALLPGQARVGSGQALAFAFTGPSGRYAVGLDVGGFDRDPATGRIDPAPLPGVIRGRPARPTRSPSPAAAATAR